MKTKATYSKQQFEYTLTDNSKTSLGQVLGNARVSFADLDKNGTIDPNTEILQTQSYYPFGLTHSGLQSPQSGKENLYQFQGQELQPELGWSQFKWRNADPTIGRFFNVDPISEDYYYNSTYAFSENRVINGIELEGLEYYYSSDGKLIGNTGDCNEVYVINTSYVDVFGLEYLQNNINDLGGVSTYVYADHDEFVDMASVLYAESGNSTSKEEVAGIFSAIENRAEKNGTSILAEINNKSEVFGANDKGKYHVDDNVGMSGKKNTVNSGLILGITSDTDFSNGATMWDGVEQAQFPATDRRESNGRFELHMNTMGWNISDEHYKEWKSNIGASFKAPQNRLAPANYPKRGYYNKGKSRLQSTAVQGKTIFWKIK